MFVDINSILPRSIQRSGLGRKMEEAQVLESFSLLADQLIPGDLRDKIRPVYLSGRVLTVASLSDFATNILKQKESEFVKLINQKLEGQIVRKLSYLT